MLRVKLFGYPHTRRKTMHLLPGCGSGVPRHVELSFRNLVHVQGKLVATVSDCKGGNDDMARSDSAMERKGKVGQTSA